MVPDDEDQHVKVDAFEKRCPPGMWCCAAAFCRKERSFSGSKSEGETNTQIEKDKKNLASTFEKRCPPGRWCHGGLELSVEPDMWLRSVLQAVRTRGVFRVFSEDLQGPFAFGSSGFQAGQSIPDVFHALSLLWFMLFGGFSAG